MNKTNLMYKEPFPIPPGETVKEYVEFFSMTMEDFAQRLGCTKQTLARIYRGEQPITEETAVKLELVTGVEANFWVNLEAQYQFALISQKRKAQAEQNFKWISQFPIVELQKRNCHITHIDNPLYHIGIDNNITYIKKTRQGVENLKILLDSYEDREQLIQYIRLLQYYSILEKTYTIWLCSLFYRIFRSLMESNFKSKHPNLTLFNLYKLGYLSYIVRRKKYQDSNL